MAILFKYTKNQVESHVIVPHIVEVKYNTETSTVYIYLVNGSVVELNSKTDELYVNLLKTIKLCWKKE
jgi:hypothetical protein